MIPIPPLTRDQVRLIDQTAVDRYHLPSILLMENAGRGAAEIIDQSFGPRRKAAIFCGVGNNGGDGLVIARHLQNFGWIVRVLIAGDPSKMTPDARINGSILEAMQLPLTWATDRASHTAFSAGIRIEEVVVDALLGTGFHGTVREPIRCLIDGINRMEKRATVAVDVPSGLDCDNGLPGGTAIHADLTVTFVAPKLGFTQPTAREYVGRVEVVDIGVPRELIEEVASER